MNSQVNWYEEDVKLAVDNATDEFLTGLAFYVEGEAKVEADVDTGFMRNAIYTVLPEGEFFGGQSGKGRKSGVYRNKQGQTVQRNRTDSTPGVGKNEAAVHGAAEYTIEQEMKHGFMYRALEKAQSVAGGLIQRAGKKHLG